MSAVIQLIEVQRTKASRGAPAAVVRNSVSDRFPMNTKIDEKGFFIQHISCRESEGFRIPHDRKLKALDDLQLSKIGLRCAKIEESLEVYYLGLPLLLPKEKRVGVLGRNTWLRIVTNFRVAQETTWAYHKYTYNIFFGEASAFNEVVLLREPQHTFSAEKELW